MLPCEERGYTQGVDKTQDIGDEFLSEVESSYDFRGRCYYRETGPILGHVTQIDSTVKLGLGYKLGGSFLERDYSQKPTLFSIFSTRLSSSSGGTGLSI